MAASNWKAENSVTAQSTWRDVFQASLSTAKDRENSWRPASINHCWKLEEAGCTAWAQQQQDRWTWLQEWRQASKKQRLLLWCPFMWDAAGRCLAHLGWGFLVKITWSRNFLSGVFISLCFSWLYMQWTIKIRC